MTEQIQILQRRLECISRALKVLWIRDLKVFSMYLVKEETFVGCPWLKFLRFSYFLDSLGKLPVYFKLAIFDYKIVKFTKFSSKQVVNFEKSNSKVLSLASTVEQKSFTR